MLTIHLRINDTATKLPTAVRLSVTGPGGEYYPPLGRLAAFACGVGEDVGGNLRIGRENFAYIDGACEIKLPAGVPLRVRATKGPEHRPLDETITLGTGQMAVRLGIERWSNLAADGWVSGDSRAHFISPHAALLEAAAEDVNVVNVLAKVHLQLMQDGNTHVTLPNLTAFSGQVPSLESGSHAVVVNTLNAHRGLGNLGLLHAHRIVFPLAFGEPFDTDDWSLIDWCEQCHRKRGLVTWVNPFDVPAASFGGEALVAAILGKVDAIEFDTLRTTPLLPLYYRLLNAGVRLPLIGGSGKDSNRVPLGGMRTYAKVMGESPNYSAWVEAVRSGQSFITNGPILSFATGERLRARAECVTPFEKLQIIADGKVIATTQSREDAGRFTAEVEANTPPDAAWLAARCVGKPSPLIPTATNFAHTSPVFRGEPRRDPAAVEYLKTCLFSIRDWAEITGGYLDNKWRTQLMESCEQASRVLDVG
ncbi:CehA/McbA family metallohydrolase [Limnoglobus roseus]|uniref:Uncharacterized protein n=1 Tax=Limnoglobus roseus TaxID=2598579 RepID=A0A5C1AFH9_9BACT|nr:CehA/McbA family metallohydrolase [Limnoglobus roseus]QEL17335.1 hypothetical protein PX52LOC_04318 [Limnoglobus roseus]